MPEKIIRDPVHDVIAFRTESPVDALLFRLINASEFQRLRRIRQLGLASLAYPGADHSRYSHSLGVMETARKIIAQLRRNFTITEEDETVVLAASLLHDLGHGPFSHVFERVTGVHHELLTQSVLLDTGSEVHRILFQHEKLLPERIVDFLRCKPKRSYHCDILSSQLDADRLDYLLRDNLMTGSGYGDYDLGWLLHALTVDTSSDRLAVTWKGVSAVEAYLQSRYHMYRNVYFHKVVRSAEGMVKLALQRARRLAVQGRLKWPNRETVIDKALTGQRMTMDQFRDLDDISVTHCFKEWCDPAYGDAKLATLCRGLLFRGLFKTIDVSHLPAEEAQVVCTRAEEAVAAAGGEAKYDLFYDEPANTPYEVLQAGGQDGGKEILVVERGGKVTAFGQISPLTTALNQQLMFRRVHFNAEYRAEVERAIGGA